MQTAKFNSPAKFFTIRYFNIILILYYQACSYDRERILLSTDEELPNLFDGQVRLCPPRDFPNGIQSASTGLVLINLHGVWRGINQLNSSYPLGIRVADSVCRQLGYTGAVVNSAKPWNATAEDYSNCYQQGNKLKFNA